MDVQSAVGCLSKEAISTCKSKNLTDLRPQLAYRSVAPRNTQLTAGLLKQGCVFTHLVVGTPCLEVDHPER